MNQYLDVAIKAARAAAALVRENFGRPLKVKSKKLTISRWSLMFAHHGIASREVSRPRDPGEEGNAENASIEFEWVIDPIDGTVNYFYGIPHFCISIALREKGDIIVGVIYDPMRDELWHAERGGKAYLNDKPIEVSQYTDISQSVVSVGMSKTMVELEVNPSIFQDLLARARKCRMMGSAALDLAYVATGRFDAYIEQSVNWWDIAAGVLWSIVPVDGWLSLQAQFKRETVGDCGERKNRPRSTHQDISMSLLESVSMCIAPLEIHFPKIGAESILENITLAGGLLPGHRIVSFVRNTITFVLSETRGQNDQTYLLTKCTRFPVLQRCS